MSDTTAERRAELELEDIVARIQRQQEETRKFVAEQHKLMAEGNKFNRDRWILPLTVMITVTGSVIVGILISLPQYLRMFGWMK